MKTRLIPALLFGFILLTRDSAWSQPMPSGDPGPSKRKALAAAEGEEAGGEEDTLSVKPARSGRKSGGKKGAAGAGAADKQVIESYVKGRISQWTKAYNSQENFGRRMNNTWDNFWARLFRERKLFEVRIGRQRMDLFESLGSLDPAAHAAAISDFDRLQANVMRSFEDAQKQKISDFFTALSNQIKDFSTDQDKQRSDMASQAVEAWQSQKSVAQ